MLAQLCLPTTAPHCEEPPALSPPARTTGHGAQNTGQATKPGVTSYVQVSRALHHIQRKFGTSLSWGSTSPGTDIPVLRKHTTVKIQAHTPNAI